METGMQYEYDVIVVGSGVAGALPAWKLAELGNYKILILEAGDNGITAGQRLQFHHMMDTQGNRGDPFAPYKDLESRKYAPAAENSQREIKDQKNDPNNYYDYTTESNDPFKASYNRMVGGSTWSWRGNTPRFNQRSAFRMTIGNDGWGRSGSPATVIEGLLKEGKYGSELPSALANRIPRMLRLSFSTEMLADKANRIGLSDKKDALEIPRPQFNFDIGDYSKGGLTEGFETAKALFTLMGAEINPKSLAENQQTATRKWNTAAHIMGTTVMGDDPKDSVVDRWGRTHDVPNLWIVGSSVFPTSSTANPTLTIAALTLRTAQAIHRELRRHDCVS
jgi:choline dehydrogenase-like flavoprotein